MLLAKTANQAVIKATRNWDWEIWLSYARQPITKEIPNIIISSKIDCLSGMSIPLSTILATTFHTIPVFNAAEPTLYVPL